jgi:hypothetical protein
MHKVGHAPVRVLPLEMCGKLIDARIAEIDLVGITWIG